MNLEICEKCKNGKWWFWDLEALPEQFKSDRKKNYISIILFSDSTIPHCCIKSVSNTLQELNDFRHPKRTFLGRLKSIFKKKICPRGSGIDRVEIDDKSCPYLLEHEFQRWYKDEYRNM